MHEFEEEDELDTYEEQLLQNSVEAIKEILNILKTIEGVPKEKIDAIRDSLDKGFGYNVKLVSGEKN